MTERQTLLAHLAEHHSSYEGRQTRRGGRYTAHSRAERWTARDTLAKLQQAHGRIHHRYGMAADHYHEPDGLGKPIGPGTAERRPSGWSTGLGVVERQSARRSG